MNDKEGNATAPPSSPDDGETRSASPSSPSPLHRPSTAPASDDAPSLVRYGPSTALRFVRRRTVEHYENLSLSELSGALGDLGTFIPLTVALARERKVALAPALFWAGVSNVVTGYAWDVPMCVQPMKSIAAVALTDAASGASSSAGLDAPSVTTAGVLTGGAMFLLGVTNLMEVVNWIVPLTVVCGLQLGVGLRLASKGIRDIQKLPWGGGYDCIGLAVACALMSMFWLRDNENGTKKKDAGDRGGSASPEKNAGTVVGSVAASSDEEAEGNAMEMGRLSGAQRLETAAALHPRSSPAGGGGGTLAALSAPQTTRPSLLRRVLKRTCCCLDPFPQTPHPVGIYLFLVGCLFAAVTLATAGPDSSYGLPLRFFGAPVVVNAMRDVTASSWRQGFLQGALPQLPLTTLNSVISVCCLAHSLYPEKRDPHLVARRRTDTVVTRREVSVSVGLMNLLLCPLGSMPNCHGAGGLAGQHRFGARHGTSVVVLGTFKVLLAVFFGASALTLLDALPVAVLGIMLVIAGLELVGTGVGMLFECVKKDEEEVRRRIMMSRGGDRTGVEVFINSKAILRKNALISMVTAGVIVALQKTHYGAISGWVVHMIYGDGFQQLVMWFNRKRRRSGEGHLVH